MRLNEREGERTWIKKHKWYAADGIEDNKHIEINNNTENRRQIFFTICRKVILKKKEVENGSNEWKYLVNYLMAYRNI